MLGYSQEEESGAIGEKKNILVDVLIQMIFEGWATTNIIWWIGRSGYLKMK